MELDRLTYKNIYIDSLHKTPDSKSTVNFSVQLKRPIRMPESSVYWISDVSIPYCWKSVEVGKWDTLYFVYYRTEADATHGTNRTYLFRTINFPPGNITVETLATTLQAGFDAWLGPFPQLNITVTHNSDHNSINISRAKDLNTLGFRILTDHELRRGTFYSKEENGFVQIRDLAYDPEFPQTINYMIHNTDKEGRLYNSDADDGSYDVKFLNLVPVRNIYILTSFGAYNSTGGVPGNVAKKIPVNTSFGNMITDIGNSFEPDFKDCGRNTLQNLSFTLVDDIGRELLLFNNHISFTLIFAQK